MASLPSTVCQGSEDRESEGKEKDITIIAIKLHQLSKLHHPTIMSTEEPEAKKAKLDENGHVEGEPPGWEDHQLNCSEAVMKGDETKHFSDLKSADVSTLQGIGPKSTDVLSALKITTVEELGKYKFFLMARALATMAETETKGGRIEGTVMNVDKAVDKEWENKSLAEICEAPTEALEGIGKDACDLLETLGVKTIGDLGKFKYCRWAESICELAKYEETKTAKERKLEAQLKKLS